MWALAKYGTDPFGTENRRYRIVCTKETERQMGDIGSFVRKKRNGGWEGTERMYGAAREKSIDFSRILYRLFSDTL